MASWNATIPTGSPTMPTPQPGDILNLPNTPTVRVIEVTASTDGFFTIDAVRVTDDETGDGAAGGMGGGWCNLCVPATAITADRVTRPHHTRAGNR